MSGYTPEEEQTLRMIDDRTIYMKVASEMALSKISRPEEKLPEEEPAPSRRGTLAIQMAISIALLAMGALIIAAAIWMGSTAR